MPFIFKNSDKPFYYADYVKMREIDRWDIIDSIQNQLTTLNGKPETFCKEKIPRKFFGGWRIDLF